MAVDIGENRMDQPTLVPANLVRFNPGIWNLGDINRTIPDGMERITNMEILDPTSNTQSGSHRSLAHAPPGASSDLRIRGFGIALWSSAPFKAHDPANVPMPCLCVCSTIAVNCSRGGGLHFRSDGNNPKGLFFYLSLVLNHDGNMVCSRQMNPPVTLAN